MFKENFIRLCNEKGIAPTVVCTSVGLSDAAFSKWTDQSVPRRATLMRIADYFGVTVDDLISLKTDIRVDLQLFAADPVENKEKEPTNMEALEKLMDDMTEQELLDLNRKLAEVLSRKKGV